MSDLGPLVRYFDAEKSAALLAMALGGVSLGGAVWAHRYADSCAP
jgi:hypothetical protein